MKKVSFLLFALIVLSVAVVLPQQIDRGEKSFVGDGILNNTNSDMTKTTTSPILVTSSGYYYFQMGWYYSAASTDIWVQHPVNGWVHVGTFWGTHPSPGDRVSLGYYNVNDQILVRIESYWHSAWYGPKYSTDSNHFIVTSLIYGWCFTFEDAVNYDGRYNDGRFIIDKSGVW